MLREVENLVAEAVQVTVPFNNPITGFCAFTHKAGIHAKAILANPSTYEMCVGLSRRTLTLPEPLADFVTWKTQFEARGFWPQQVY